MKKLTPEQDAAIEKFCPGFVINPGDVEQFRIHWTKALDFCGCGQPDQARHWMAKLLRALDLRDGWIYSGQAGQIMVEGGLADGPARYVFLYWLDQKGYIEHGGTVTGSWLTDKGRAMLPLLELDAEALG